MHAGHKLVLRISKGTHVMHAGHKFCTDESGKHVMSNHKL